MKYSRLARLIGAGLLFFASVCARGQDTPRELEPAPVDSGFCSSNGLRIHYKVYGEGRPIVLVHGWGGNIGRSWFDTGWILSLQASRRIIAIDIRGHGRSDKPHDQKVYGYGSMAEDVLAVMDHLKIEKADFLGYSMGSFIGAYLLGHSSNRFSSMILGGIGDETEISANACIEIAAALRAVNPEEIKNPLWRMYRTYAAADPGNDLEALALSALQMWPEGYPVQLGGPGLKTTNIPVIIVNGEKDFPYILSGEKLAAEIPHAELFTIPGANHVTAASDSRFKNAALEFLNKH